MSSENLYSPPSAVLEHVDPDTADLSNIPVSEKWRERFRLIERAGGVKLPKIKELPFGQRMKVLFNVFGVLFGPFYYCAKGMWKKGLALFVVCTVVAIIAVVALDFAGLDSLSNSVGFGVAAIYAFRANIDYYKKMVLEQNGWW